MFILLFSNYRNARSVRETNVIENYANPLYQHSHRQEGIEYESVDDSKRTPTAPKKPPVTSIAKNEYTAVRYDSQSPELLEMRCSADVVEDQL